MARAALLLAAAVVAAACSGGGAATTTAPAIPDLETTTTASAPEATGATGGRLVVLGEDGNLATMRPDGSDRVDLTSDAGQLLRITQPTWSPDGTRVAWTQVDGRDGTVTSSLITARADGSQRTEAVVGFPPFYIYWDPTSTRLAYLGTGATRLEMGIVDVAAGGTEAGSINGGQPFYFSWAPEGDRMLAHVGTDRLEFLDLEGNAEPLDVAPGGFQAPGWVDDRQVYVVADGDGQRLVLRDAVTGAERTLLEYQGFIQFLLSPDGTRIAFQIAGEQADAGVVASGLNAVLASAPLAQAPSNSLSVLDIASGDITTVTLSLVIAFFWSPDGLLLSMAPETGPDGERWFSWTVWDGSDELVRTDLFRPSLTFAQDYLPFFEQYAQSMSPWAPDGSAFTYTGATERGAMGVWVQPAARGASATLVADGVFASWAPGS